MRTCAGLARLVAPIAALALPSAAAAHPGDAHGFIAGLAHPWTGLDHLIALFALGCWAVLQGGRGILRLPAAVLLGVAAGSGAALLGHSQALGELSVVSSIAIVGLLIALRHHVPERYALLAAGAFGVVHGYAHAAQESAQGSLLSVTAGFLVSTLLLQLAGMLFCRAMLRRRMGMSVRSMGTAFVLAGAVMLTLG